MCGGWPTPACALNKVPIAEQLVLHLFKVLRLVLILSEAERVQHGRTQVAPHPLQLGGHLDIVKGKDRDRICPNELVVHHL
jgi:hypothetical protein